MDSSKPLKEVRISARVDARFKQQLLQVEKVTGMSESLQITSSVSALCNYVEEFGHITLPLEVVPASEHQSLSKQRRPSKRRLHSAKQYSPSEQPTTCTIYGLTEKEWKNITRLAAAEGDPGPEAWITRRIRLFLSAHVIN